MGMFDDMKRAAQAGPITVDNTVVVPSRRIDTLVVDPDSGEQLRRTDYVGTIWYGGLPQMVGAHPLPGANVHISAPFWLPDSHRYEPGAAADVQIQSSASVQGAMATSGGGNFQIFGVEAALGAEPQPSGALVVFVAVTAVAHLPLGVAYRVTTLCAPEDLRRSDA